MNPLKPLKFLGSSHDDLCAFPQEVRHAIGVELMVVQFGGAPSDFKPMHTVGDGVYEIRVRDATGAFRVIKTSKLDIALAQRRYKLIGANS